MPYLVLAPFAFREIDIPFPRIFISHGILFFNSTLNPVLNCRKIREVRRGVKNGICLTVECDKLLKSLALLFRLPSFFFRKSCAMGVSCRNKLSLNKPLSFSFSNFPYTFLGIQKMF